MDLSSADFETLPDMMEVKVKGWLKLTCCDNLAYLEGLPNGLKKLYCYSFDSLTSLKGFPEGLQEIDCSYCEALTSLEGCPTAIESINVSYCPKLKYIPTDIPNKAIKGLIGEQITEYKANW